MPLPGLPGFVQPLRAGILVPLVAEHAVMDLAQDFARVHPPVGQLEAVAAAQAPVGSEHRFGERGLGMLHVDEMPVVQRFGKAEDDPGAIGAIVQARGAPSFQAFDFGLADSRTCRRPSRDPSARSRRGRSPARVVSAAAVVRDGFAVSRATTASSSGVETTCAPPFKSGSARRLTKSILKRKRSSCAAVLRRIASSIGCRPGTNG